MIVFNYRFHICCKAFMYGFENMLYNSKDKYQQSQLTMKYHQLQNISPRSAQQNRNLTFENSFQKKKKRKNLYPRTFPMFIFLILSKFPINTANI